MWRLIRRSSLTLSLGLVVLFMVFCVCGSSVLLGVSYYASFPPKSVLPSSSNIFSFFSSEGGGDFWETGAARWFSSVTGQI